MTRTGAIIMRWDSTTRGREAAGFEAFGGVLGYFEELAKEGRIIGHREYFTLDGSGTILLEGLLPELHQIVQEDEFMRQAVVGQSMVEGFSVEICAGGSDQTIQELMALEMGTQQELGLIP
jgi:hypothetical protein